MMKIVLILAFVALASADIEAPGNNAHYVTWSKVEAAGVSNWAKPSGMCVKFTAQGSNDAHILLSPIKDVARTDRAYEIVLGGWGNTRSVIRYGTQGHVLDTFPVNVNVPGDVMSAHEARKFWINMIDGELNVGRGDECYMDVLLTASFLSDDPDRIDNIKYMAFGAWNTPVFYDGASLGTMPSTSDWLQFNVPGNLGIYHVFNRPNSIVVNSAQFEIVFKARTRDTATIGFLPAVAPAATNAIEFTLDARNGTQTNIMMGTRASGKSTMLSAHAQTNEMLVFNEYRTFWIRKYGSALAIGHGAIVDQDAVVIATIPDLGLEQYIIGWTAGDYPAQYWMMNHWSGRMPENCEQDDMLEDYYEDMLDSGFLVEDFKDPSGFHCKQIDIWKSELGGEHKLTKDDYKKWYDLMYQLSEAGNPTAIAIMRGTYPKPSQIKKGIKTNMKRKATKARIGKPAVTLADDREAAAEALRERRAAEAEERTETLEAKEDME